MFLFPLWLICTLVDDCRIIFWTISPLCLWFGWERFLHLSSSSSLIMFMDQDHWLNEWVKSGCSVYFSFNVWLVAFVNYPAPFKKKKKKKNLFISFFLTFYLPCSLLLYIWNIKLDPPKETIKHCVEFIFFRERLCFNKQVPIWHYIGKRKEKILKQPSSIKPLPNRSSCADE